MSFLDLRKELHSKYGIKDKEDEEQSSSITESSNSNSDKKPHSDFADLRNELMLKYKPETVVDDSFINTFVSDANKYTSGVKNDYDSIGFSNADKRVTYNISKINDLLRRRRAIRQYLSKKKSSYEGYDTFVSYLDDLDKGLRQYYDAFSQAGDYYSQWETEEEYNQHLQNQKEYEEKLNFDIEAGQKELEDLEAQRDSFSVFGADGLDGALKNLAKFVTEGGSLDDLDDLEGTIQKKRLYLEEAKRLQEGARLSSVADPESELYDPEFESYTKYVSTEVDSVWEKLWSEYGMGYGDMTYEYINGDEDFRSEVNRKHTIYASDSPRAVESEYEKHGYDYMTEDEVSIYNYYYAKNGKEAAEKYLDSIQETLNHRKATSMYAGMEDNTLLELAFGVAAGLDQFESGIEGLMNAVTGNEEYTPPSATQIASGMVREDLADSSIPLWYNFKDGQWEDKVLGNSLGQIAYDATTTTSNMLPSILASTASNFILPGSGAIVGTVLLGASAGGNAYQEMINLGYDKGQARSYAALVGGSEAGLSYLLSGISSLGGKVSNKAINGLLNKVDNAFARVAIKLGGNMASEFTEEYLQEVLTPWFQNIALGTKNDIDLISPDALYSGLLGALTAGIMEGGSVVSGEVNIYQTGKKLQAADISAQRLSELGKTFAADTVAHQLAGRVNENTGAYTMGRLFNEIGAEVTELNKADIEKSLIRKNISAKDAKVLSESFAQIVTGAELTDGQIAMIEANDVLAKTVRDVIINPNSTVNQRSQGYNQMLMDMAREKTAPSKSSEAGEEIAPTADTVNATNKNGPEGLSEAVDTSPMKATSITAIKDRQAVVKLDDGSEVNVRDADLSPDEGVRIETIARIDGISTEDANFILNTLRTNTGASAQMDSLGADEAYKYGFYGFSKDHMTSKGVFANSLTEAQRDAIYETGRNARQRQVDKKNATVSKNAVSEKSSAPGKVHFEGDRSTLTERQSASITALEKVAEALGVQIYVFESKVNERGKRVGANGWYDPKDGSIHIDLHAGTNGEGTMLFTAAHELTHFIRQWSPAKFKILADFLMQEYGQKGVNVDALVREQMAKAKRNGRTISYDTAYEEVIADSMEMMLSDGKVMEKLAKLKAQDKSLWQKIKDFINELAAKIRAVYEGMTPDSVEGRYVAEMVDTIDKLQNLFAESLMEASENYQASLTPGEESVADNENGDTVTQVDRDLEADTKYSIREEFYKEFDAWDGKNPSITFTVGTTSDALKSVGVKDQEIKLRTGVVLNKMNKHPEITREIFKQVPELLEHPVIVQFSDAIDQDTGKPKYDSNITVLGELYAKVKENGKEVDKPVLVSLELQPTNQKKTVILDFILITSAYSKNALQRYINENSILYIDPNKKRTDNWLSLNRLQLPVGETNYGSIRKIAYVDGKVKVQNPKNMTQVQKKLFEAGKIDEFGNKLFSDRDYSYDALVSKPDMLVTEVGGNVPKNRADVAHMAKQNAANVGKFDPKTGSVSVHVDDIDTDVVLSTKGLRHGLRRTNDPLNVPNYIVTVKAGEILKNSIRINEITPSDENAKSSYVLLGAAKDASGTYVVRFVINHFDNSITAMDVLYALNAKKEPAATKSPRLTAKPLSVTGSTISISELLDIVNQYFPDILPEEVLKHYGYDARPEGDFAENALYSDRDTESVSNRSLLANALEGAAQKEIERNKIQEYKGKIDLINAEERKLSELNEKIKDLSFAKGPRDTKAIRDLQFEAKQTANRISTYDKQLLRLEASKPLQDVLTREKKAAYKRAEQKGKEALAAYREKATKTQRELMERWQESRKTAVAKARETAEKRDARAKLQKLVLDTVKWVSYPAKTDVKCPDFLKQPYADFLNGIDLSSKRLADGGDPTKTDLRLANAMGSLATALERVMTSQDPNQETTTVLDVGYLDLPANFVQKLRDMTEDVKAMMIEGDYVVNTMSAEEVRKLSQMIRTLNHAIKEVSTLYANLRFANVEMLSDESMTFMDVIGEIQKSSGTKDFALWDNALPYYAFKRFGKGGESVFEGLMDAQDKLAYLAKDIFDFQEKTWTGKEAKEWSEDTHTVNLPDGEKLTMTTADAMSIYCLSRRQQGLQHLLGGGVRVVGIQKGSQKTNDSRSTLTIKDIDAIISSLTERQKKVAESIQEFMSTTCSEWGNEISMKRFLTKEFNEKFYFPIESNDENLPTKDPSAQQSDLFRLLNISATKPIDPRANNEVIIRNIFDVFSGHASDMARLNAFGLPLLDYMKWLNYREKTANENGQIDVRGVRKCMEKAYGKAAKSYVLNLVKDVNGRPSDNGDPSILMKWMRAAKTASVGSSLRVAALQITSYPRAALVLSPKSLALGLTKIPNIEKAKQYCGIALWKSFGFYDTNISRSIEDQMKGVKDVKQKLIELSLKGAEWGDAITWGALWNACEYEVASTKKYKVGTEEFYQAVGKKLRDVVYRTQVVDSTLTRSQMMRSKRGMAQEAAAFMSEPTLSANILMDAGMEFNLEKRRTGSAKAAWKKTGKYVCRAVAVYSIGQLAAALVEGLWDAWRDDEDEEFGEKYINAFTQNLVLDLVPFNKIPIVSDVFEAVLAMFDVGFYSSDKMSTTWLTQAVSAADAWRDVLGGNSSVTTYNALYKTIRAMSSFYGVSFSGVMREGVALWNNTAGAYDVTLKVLSYDRSKADLGGLLLDAIVEGNDRQADSLRDKFEDESECQSALRTAIKDRYKAGEINQTTALKYLIKYGGMEEDDAYWKVEEWEYENETGEEFSKYNDFISAVETGRDLKSVIKQYTDNGVEMEDIVSQITRHFKPIYIEMSASKKASIKGYLLNAFEQCGVDRETAETKIAKWQYEADHPELADKITYSQYTQWETNGKARGVSLDVFADVAEFRNGGGDTKSQEEVAGYINSLSISKAQKDALWCCFWKESTLNKAPWN